MNEMHDKNTVVTVKLHILEEVLCILVFAGKEKLRKGHHQVIGSSDNNYLVTIISTGHVQSVTGNKNFPGDFGLITKIRGLVRFQR